MDTGSQEFKDIRHQPAFVDKSMLLEYVITDMSRILIVAPRKFGKSVNLSMMKTFFELVPDETTMKDNRDLFKELTITKKCPETVEKHCGKYPILYLDFKSTGNIDSFQDALESIADVVHRAYQMHQYILIGDKLREDSKDYVKTWIDTNRYKTFANKWKGALINACQNLAGYLKKYFGKQIILLVDEYDNICSKAFISITDKEEFNSVVHFCTDMLGSLAKGNSDVDRAILTGTSFITTMGAGMGLMMLTSPLNNLMVYRFQRDNDISKFYGLTLKELDNLLQKFDKSCDRNKIVSFYNGYRNQMLNIWSVMQYLNNGNVKNYRREFGIAVDLDKILEMESVRSKIEQLLNAEFNKVVFRYITPPSLEDLCDLKDILNNSKTIHSPCILFNFLLEQGYLSVVDLNSWESKVTCKIPNLEIETEFREKLMKFYQDKN